MSGLLICTQVVDERDENLGFFVSWLRAFAASGRQIYVLAWRVDSTTKLPPNVHVTQMPKGKLRRTFTLWSFTLKHRKDFDSVFVHMMAPVAVVSGWLWKILGMRVALWYTHGDVPLSLKTANIFVDHIFTATEDSMRLKTSKKIVTGHGIDLDIYKAQNIPRRPLLISVGRIAPRKDQIAFVKLCAHLRDAGISFSAMIVGLPRVAGDVAYSEEVMKAIASNHLESIVEMVGSKTGSELIKIYSEAALFVSTSKTGSLDKVVLESLACETPAIAIGESFRGFPGVTIVPDVVGDEAFDIVRGALAHPIAHPEARAGVAAKADLHLLIKKLESNLYAK